MIEKQLWMRSANFGIIKDLLHIINDNNGKYRATQLEKIGIEKNILIKSDGQPLTHTPRYYYRKILENLNLVEKINSYYYISESAIVKNLLEYTEVNKPLSDEAKEIFSEIIVRNKDCREYFFNLFLDREDYSLKELRKFGDWITVETFSMLSDIEKLSLMKENYRNLIVLKNKKNNSIVLKTKNQKDAIYDGVRKWSYDLGITDEIMINFKDGRYIYPIEQDFNPLIIDNLLFKIINESKTDSGTILIHIPNFILKAALNTRFSIEKIKKHIIKFKNQHSQSIIFIPSSTVMIDIKSPFGKHDEIIRNSYIYEPRQGYISHLRVYPSILNEENK